MARSPSRAGGRRTRLQLHRKGAEPSPAAGIFFFARKLRGARCTGNFVIEIVRFDERHRLEYFGTLSAPLKSDGATIHRTWGPGRKIKDFQIGAHRARFALAERLCRKIDSMSCLAAYSEAPRYVLITTLIPVAFAPHVNLTFSSSLPTIWCCMGWRFIFSGRSIRFLGGAWLSWQSSEAVRVG